MAKAMLIMDMPSSCVECDFCVEVGGNEFVCRASNETDIFYKTIDFDVVYNYNDKATWCPLREVPRKKPMRRMLDDASLFYRQGYNACIDEILGGAENG